VCHPKNLLFLAFFLNYKKIQIIFKYNAQIKIFSFQKHFTLFSKTLSLCKWFINKNVFVSKTIILSFQKHFRFAKGSKTKLFSFKKYYFSFKHTVTFFRKHFHFAKKKKKSKAFRKQIASAFLVVADACHPPLRGNVST